MKHHELLFWSTSSTVNANIDTQEIESSTLYLIAELIIPDSVIKIIYVGYQCLFKRITMPLIAGYSIYYKGCRRENLEFGAAGNRCCYHCHRMLVHDLTRDQSQPLHWWNTKSSLTTTMASIWLSRRIATSSCLFFLWKSSCNFFNAALFSSHGVENIFTNRMSSLMGSWTSVTLTNKSLRVIFSLYS